MDAEWDLTLGGDHTMVNTDDILLNHISPFFNPHKDAAV